MLVDVHAHIGQLSAAAARPTRIGLYAGTCGLDAVLVSNQDAAAEPRGAANQDEVDANETCLTACRSQSRLVPLYWVRAGQFDSQPDAMAGALATEPFAGVVFAPAANHYEADDPLLNPYLTALERTVRPALFCVTDAPAATPARVVRLAERHPRVPVILCCCGGSADTRAALLDAVGSACKRKAADVYVDTSHADGDGIRAAIRALGADRVLFGTDALRHGDAHIPRTIALLDELRKTVPGVEFEQVAGGNAARLFGLGGPGRLRLG